MSLRRRQRGLRPAVVGSVALLLVACGASTEVTEAPPTPTADISPSACDLLSDADISAALATPVAPGSPAPTPGSAIKGDYEVTKVQLSSGAKTVGQCIWKADNGAEVIAQVMPNAQVSQLADYTTGAIQLGAAYIQESFSRGFVSVQHGNGVIAITLVLTADTATRTSRLADLARAASGAPIPSVAPGALPSATAAPSAAVASAPGEKVSGQTAASKVKETDNLSFSPTSVSIKAGDVLEWDNSGSIAHNVTFDAYSDISSDTMSGGDTFQVKFTKPGTYQFHCTFHPGMEGSVTVT